MTTAMTLLRSRTSSVAFGAAGSGRAACRFSLRRGRDAGAGRRERVGQVADRAVDPAAAAGRGADRAGRIVLDGQEMLGADARTLHRPRGGTAGMIFQEPMTSLNPLHRIGRQVAEAMRAARPRAGAAAAAAHHRAARPRRLCRRREPARSLPAPAQRRPAAAGDDRHGARQRPQAADRRRADHGARRDDPGRILDLLAAEKRRAAGAAADQPRPERRPPGRRPHLRDEGRRAGRERARSPMCSARRSIPTRAC